MRRARLQIKPNLAKPKAASVTLTAQADDDVKKVCTIEESNPTSPIQPEINDRDQLGHGIPIPERPTDLGNELFIQVSTPVTAVTSPVEIQENRAQSPSRGPPSPRKVNFRIHNSADAKLQSPLLSPPAGGRRSRLNSMCSTYSSTSPTRLKPKKFTGDEKLDTKTMRMVDLIAWNPKSEKGMEKKKLINETIESQPKENNLPPSPAKAVAAPQVTIGPDGRIVLDEASLVVREVQEAEVWETVDEDRVNRRITSMSFRSRLWRKGTAWSEKETDLFYEILRCTGPDFGLMHEFLPTRARNELKSKYNREEKLNWARVKEAMEMPALLDNSLYEKSQKMIDEIQEDEKQKKLAKQKGKKNSGAEGEGATATGAPAEIDWDEQTADLIGEAEAIINELERGEQGGANDGMVVPKKPRKPRVSKKAAQLLQKTETAAKKVVSDEPQHTVKFTVDSPEKRSVAKLDGYSFAPSASASTPVVIGDDEVVLSRPKRNNKEIIEKLKESVKNPIDKEVASSSKGFKPVIKKAPRIPMESRAGAGSAPPIPLSQHSPHSPLPPVSEILHPQQNNAVSTASNLNLSMDDSFTMNFDLMNGGGEGGGYLDGGLHDGNGMDMMEPVDPPTDPSIVRPIPIRPPTMASLPGALDDVTVSRANYLTEMERPSWSTDVPVTTAAEMPNQQSTVLQATTVTSELDLASDLHRAMNMEAESPLRAPRAFKRRILSQSSEDEVPAVSAPATLHVYDAPAEAEPTAEAYQAEAEPTADALHAEPEPTADAYHAEQPEQNPFAPVVNTEPANNRGAMSPLYSPPPQRRARTQSVQSSSVSSLSPPRSQQMPEEDLNISSTRSTSNDEEPIFLRRLPKTKRVPLKRSRGPHPSDVRATASVQPALLVLNKPGTASVADELPREPFNQGLIVNKITREMENAKETEDEPAENAMEDEISNEPVPPSPITPASKRPGSATIRRPVPKKKRLAADSVAKDVDEKEESTVPDVSSVVGSAVVESQQEKQKDAEAGEPSRSLSSPLSSPSRSPPHPFGGVMTGAQIKRPASSKNKDLPPLIRPSIRLVSASSRFLQQRESSEESVRERKTLSRGKGKSKEKPLLSPSRSSAPRSSDPEPPSSEDDPEKSITGNEMDTAVQEETVTAAPPPEPVEGPVKLTRRSAIKPKPISSKAPIVKAASAKPVVPAKPSVTTSPVKIAPAETVVTMTSSGQEPTVTSGSGDPEPSANPTKVSEAGPSFARSAVSATPVLSVEEPLVRPGRKRGRR